eukprot:1998315-Rhodomonas_salina.1
MRAEGSITSSNSSLHVGDQSVWRKSCSSLQSTIGLHVSVVCEYEILVLICVRIIFDAIQNWSTITRVDGAMGMTVPVCSLATRPLHNIATTGIVWQ